MWRASATENGEFAPSPSRAIWPGAVEKASKVPAPVVAPLPRLDGEARPRHIGDALLHVRHDLLAEEQLTHSLLRPALSNDVIGHGDEITTSALER
jgi:hypothetical protein